MLQLLLALHGALLCHRVDGFQVCQLVLQLLQQLRVSLLTTILGNTSSDQR